MHFSFYNVKKYLGPPKNQHKVCTELFFITKHKARSKEKGRKTKQVAV
jgi:hypothetical protein